MKLTKLKPVFRGLAATTAALLTLSTVGYSVAKSDLAVGMVDDVFGVDRTIYNEWEEKVDSYTIPGALEGFSYLKGKNYATTYKDVDAYFAAAKAHAIKQGEEGFALLKNDNKALPLASGSKVALFGWSAYNLPNGHTGVVANNSDKITLDAAFKAIDGITVNETITTDDFTGKMAKASYSNYKPPEKFEVKDSWKIDAGTTGIVVIGRGGGEGANYQADKGVYVHMVDKLDENGNKIPDIDPETGEQKMTTGRNPQPVWIQEQKVEVGVQDKDPLALSDDELAMVKYAKEHCAKTVVLVVSANAMELGELVKAGDYNVDAIGFCGIPNAYQYQGIANVLAGKVNATGGLTDTYVYDNSYNPAVINMGQQQYSDTDTIANATDPLNRQGAPNYRANNYIVEAEGIYVGYKYYETRYFDSIANPTYNANAAVGNMGAWSYDKEVIFPFGQGLSYIPYEQRIVNVVVDNAETGSVTATVEVTNKGTEEGTFLTQLYVNKPYTKHDIDNNVEKSAVDFLNSAKVKVAPGKSERVDITLPTRYLASWDSSALSGAGTYVLDEGTYYFTAAAGAHAAVNNFLAAQKHKTDGTTTISDCKTWELAKFDEKTFSKSNGVDVRNQMKNSDINYFYGQEKVKYLSRSDWQGTFVKNYTDYENESGIKSEAKFTIKGAAKEAEWITELISAQYKITAQQGANVDIAGIKPEGMAEGQSVWQWILSFATTDPEAFSNINSKEWQAVAKAIPLGSAISSVIDGGGTTKIFGNESYNLGNPSSTQSESVAGYSQSITLADSSKRNLAIASNTLLGASFNPDLAYAWGRLEGEGGLWLQAQGVGNGNAITVWGAGLNQHRHPYNGRNSEYMSEDPMLTNRIGEGQLRGAVEMGAICGPKHMGFNDQELNRQGNACYMTEQKVRECDTRCYEGALRVDEANGTGVMMSFARIGATNVTNSVGYIKNIMRGEWGFTGIISTDMGMGQYYHEAGALIMATVNELAGFGRSTYFAMGDMVNGSNNLNNATDTAVAGSQNHITLGLAASDPVFAEQARQTALYHVYTLAHSGSGVNVERVKNNGEDIVVPAYTINHRDPVGVKAKVGWEYIFIALEVVFGILLAASAGAWIASIVLSKKEED